MFSQPSAAELSRTFNRVLAALLSGELEACPTDTGLGEATMAALDAIPGAPHSRAAVARARQAFDQEK